LFVYSVCDYLFSLYAFRIHYLHGILLSFQVISAFLIVTIVFIPIGVASLIASRDVRLNAILFFDFCLQLWIVCVCWLLICYNWSLYQVVEIVDRYEAACVPSNWTDKVAYIQSAADKTCTRTLHVWFINSIFSLYLFLCYFCINSVLIIDELWIPNFDDHLF
jgi:hypothetical protein